MLDEQQMDARDTTGISVIVSASAGAGKTSVLVERLLKRCLVDHVPLERILAMTFTKAAAQEMKSRLASGLSQHLAQAETKEERNWISDQLIALSAAQITTIDSWCLAIIQKYAAVIGLDPAVCTNVLDEGTRQVMSHEAFCQCLGSMDMEKAYRLATMFSARSEDYSALEQAVNSVNTHAQSAFDPSAFYQDCRDKYSPVKSLSDFDPDILAAFFDRMILSVSNLNDLLDEMETAAQGDEKVDPKTLQGVRNGIVNVLDALQQHSWGLYLSALETLALLQTSASTKNLPYDRARKDFSARIKALLAGAQDEATLVSDANDMVPIVNDFLDLCENTADTLARMKADNTCMDFSDMERYVLAILQADHGETAARIRDSYDEIMVDEFQDTSTLQNAIINAVAKKDNVFRVGDVKQSIYRFRSARPALMRACLKDPEEKHITLRHNFRSMESIVTFNNILFGSLMNVEGMHDRYTEDDKAAIGRKEQQEEPVPVIFTFVSSPETQGDEDAEEENEDAKQLKAAWIASHIAAMHEDGHPFSDFAVLVRSHASKIPLRNAFDDAGIPYDIDAREGFWKSDLCVLIQAMAGWMLNPDDAISMTTVLTSAFCQFSDEELAKMKVGHKTLVQGVREAHPELFEAFARLRQTADKDGIPALMDQIAKTNNFYDLLSDKDQANFDFLCQKINAKQPVSLYDFLVMMRNGADEKSSEALSHGTDDDVVRVCTIHQSKGLQYKIVFLWSDSQNRFQDDKAPVIIHDELKLGLGWMDIHTRLKRPTVQELAVSHACNLEDQEEFIRLLYVALTRPQQRLFIVDSEPKRDYSRSLTRGVIAARRGMSGLILAAMKEGPYFEVHHESLAAIPKLTKKKTVYPAQLPHMHAQEDINGALRPSETEYTSIPPLSRSSHESGKAYGTLMHETIASLPDKVWTMEDIHEGGLTPADQQKLVHFANTALYRQCLQMHIHKEYAFYVIDTESRHAITGAMDFVAEDPGKVIMIDFKTDDANDAEIRKRYQAQIDTYRRALEILYPERVIETYGYSFHNEDFIPF